MYVRGIRVRVSTECIFLKISAIIPREHFILKNAKLSEYLAYSITAPADILLNTFWVKLFSKNRKCALLPDTSCKRSHKGSDNNLKYFLCRTAVTCKQAWFVCCTNYMPPFFTSVTLYPVCLWWILIFFSTYWTHGVRHAYNSSDDRVSSYNYSFTFCFKTVCMAHSFTGEYHGCSNVHAWRA